MLITVSGGTNGVIRGKTGPKGRFSMSLPAGVYDVEASMPGFRGQPSKKVSVPAGGEAQASFGLAAAASDGAASRIAEQLRSQLEEIVVTGSFVEGVLAERRFSESVIDAVGANDFAVTGDSNVVDALARVTGVTIVDDKFVYVRGLGERYSNILFNNSQLPSPDPARRVVPLDLFPSGVMEQLSIRKTYSPYLPGNFSGGAIEMTTRMIPDERELRLSFSTAYNDETTFRDDIDWQDGGKLDWSGFDDGSRDFPSSFNLFPASEENPFLTQNPGDDAVAIMRLLNNDLDTDELVIRPDFRMSGSWGDSRETGGGSRFGHLIGVSMSNTWSYTAEKRRLAQIAFAGAEVVPRNSVTQFETSNDIQYSALATFELALSDTNILTSTIFYTRETSKRNVNDQADFEFTFVPNEDFFSTLTWEWEERQMVTAQLEGEHLLESLGDTQLKWRATYSRANRDKPDTMTFQTQTVRGEGTGLCEFTTCLQRRWEYLVDDSVDAGVDLEKPVSITDDITSTLKFGGKVFYKNRDSINRLFSWNVIDRQEYRVLRQTASLSELFAPNNIGPDGVFLLREQTQFNDNYRAEETELGAYFQMDTELFTNWRLMLGVRYEKGELVSKLFNNRFERQESSLDTEFWLPAASLTWSFLGNHQIRAAYSETLNRPDIRELQPTIYFDPEVREEFLGNPDLEVAEVTNYDLRWEWYYGGLDNISLGLFYKEIDSPIEITLLPVDSDNVLRQYFNGDTAELYGAELTWRQTLAPLSDYVRDFYLKFNGTMMTSEVTLPEEGTLRVTNLTRPMVGQSDWIVNAQLTYDNVPRDVQVTFAFNMAAEYIADVGSLPLDDSYIQPRPLLDFNLRYGIKLFDRDMRLRFKVNNILDAEYERTRSGVQERFFREGRTFTFGVDTDF